MVVILGKKRWEALPLHGTEDRWSVTCTKLIMVAAVLYQEINSCLVESICQRNEELWIRNHC